MSNKLIIAALPSILINRRNKSFSQTYYVVCLSLSMVFKHLTLTSMKVSDIRLN